MKAEHYATAMVADDRVGITLACRCGWIGPRNQWALHLPTDDVRERSSTTDTEVLLTYEGRKWGER